MEENEEHTDQRDVNPNTHDVEATNDVTSGDEGTQAVNQSSEEASRQLTMATAENLGEAEEEGEGTMEVGVREFEPDHQLTRAVQTSRNVTLKGEINMGGSINKTENVYTDQRHIQKTRQYVSGDLNYVTNTPSLQVEHHHGDVYIQGPSDTAAARDGSSIQIDASRDVFVETESYRHALRTMEKHGVLFITGPPHTGKSSLGMALLRRYRDVCGFAPIVLETYEEWRQHSSGKKQVILLDCDLQTEHLLKLVENHFTTLRTLAKEKQRLTVVTVRENVLKDCGLGMHSFDGCLLDMVKTSPFTENDKKQLMQKHLLCKSKSFDEDVFREILKVDKSGLLFPLKCRQFAEQVREGQCPVSLFSDQQEVSICGLAPITQIHITSDMLHNCTEQKSCTEFAYYFVDDKRLYSGENVVAHPILKYTDSTYFPPKYIMLPLEVVAVKGESEIHTACRKNDVDKVEKLLQSSTCANECTEQRLSPLHLACFAGNEAVVKLLLQHNAKVDIRDKLGWSPLHVACTIGHTEIVRLLVRHLVPGDNLEGQTADKLLRLACKNYHKDLVTKLKACKANKKDEVERLNVCSSCFSKHKAALTTINWHKANNEINAYTLGPPRFYDYTLLRNQTTRMQGVTWHNIYYQQRYTCLCLASIHGHTNIARILLEHGACTEMISEIKFTSDTTVPSVEPPVSSTPLVAACCFGHADVVELLQDYGATVTGDNTVTPLIAACFHGHLDVVKVLMDHPLVDVKAVDSKGRNPLHAAVIGTSEQLRLEGLKRYEDNKTSDTSKRFTYIEPKRQHLDIIKLLSARLTHQDINEEDYTSCPKTALEYACALGCSRADVACVLLELGADPNKGSANDSPLHLACQQGNLDLVQILLDFKGNINISRNKTLHKHTYFQQNENVTGPPLFWAVYKSHADVVSLLVKKGAQTDSYIDECGTLLHLIDVSRCDSVNEIHPRTLRTVQVLVESGVDVNAKDPDGQTALFRFCKNLYHTVVKYLLEKGAKVVEGLLYFVMKLYDGTFYDPSNDRLTEILKSLLENDHEAHFSDDKEKEGTIVESFIPICSNKEAAKLVLLHMQRRGVRTPTDDTALHLACKHSTLEVVTSLLEAGADPNFQNKEGMTPLHVAIAHGYHAVQLVKVKTLLDHGANMEIKDRHGNTPLMIAMNYGNPEMITTFIERGADVFTENDQHQSPAKRLVQVYGHLLSGENSLLEKRLINLEKTDSRGNTLLHMACENVRFCVKDIVCAMVKDNCTFDRANVDGDTPLHVACSHDCKQESLSLLIQHCNVNAVNLEGNTPLHVAVRRLTNYPDFVVSTLLENGANCKMTNTAGKSPKEVLPENLLEYNKKEILKLFEKHEQQNHLAALNASTDIGGDGTAEKVNQSEEQEESKVTSHLLENLPLVAKTAVADIPGVSETCKDDTDKERSVQFRQLELDTAIPPVFMQTDSSLNALGDEVSVAEMCSACEETTGSNSILGACEETTGSNSIGAHKLDVWAIYPSSNEARTKLLLWGVVIRGNLLTFVDKHPSTAFTTDCGTNVERTTLTIGNLPLCFSNNRILESLRALGVRPLSTLFMERGKNKAGEYTRFLTGRRFIYIQVPKQPLPEFVDIDSSKVSFFYPEQKNN